MCFKISKQIESSGDRKNKQAIYIRGIGEVVLSILKDMVVLFTADTGRSICADL